MDEPGDVLECIISVGDFPYLFDNEAYRKRLASFKPTPWNPPNRPTTERIEIDGK